MSSYQDILYEVKDGVAVVTLSRPERLNAWRAEMEREVRQAMKAAAEDEAVRVIVLTGAGRGFCAGADMGGLQATSAASRGEGAAPAAARVRPGPFDPNSRSDFQKQYSYFPAVPKPIIAAINGACAGIGLAQALMCDLRFAAAGAKLTTSFARRGLIAEHGTSWLLPRLVGTARALDLLLSARVVLAEEARELGLVNQVVPPEQLLPVALDYARDLARNSSPTSMSVIKRQVLRHLDLSLDEALADSNALMAQSLRRPDLAEGVASFVERRLPRFEPLQPDSTEA